MAGLDALLTITFAVLSLSRISEFPVFLVIPIKAVLYAGKIDLACFGLSWGIEFNRSELCFVWK